jgi:hypothetical protein
MMSYSVITNENEGYDLFEKDSGLTIELDLDEEKDARSLCRKLNLGSGFAGWTPIFFTQKYLN